MYSLPTIIVEDEELARKDLENILKTHCPEIELLGHADTYEKAVGEINLKSPELVFLDINIPGKSGIELLSEIKNRDFDVIVVSASESFGISAIKENVLDYVLKPVMEEDVQMAVNKAIRSKIDRQSKKTDNKIVFNVQNGFRMVELDNIIYFEGKENYTEIITREDSFLVAKTLKDFEDFLRYKKFYRIHKKHLINMKHIFEFSYKDGGYVILSNNTRLNISRNRLKDFVKYVNIYALNINKK